MGIAYTLVKLLDHPSLYRFSGPYYSSELDGRWSTGYWDEPEQQWDTFCCGQKFYDEDDYYNHKDVCDAPVNHKTGAVKGRRLNTHG